MRKILFFVPTFSNLSETFILREIDLIDRRGNLDIHIVSLKPGKAELPDNLISKVSYISINFSDILYTFSFTSKNLKTIFKVGLNFFKTSEDGFFRNLKNFTKALIYAFKLSVFKFDHMHIHFLSDISTIISLASQILKKPFSISGHARDVFIEGSSINFKVKYAKFITLCNTKAFLKCLALSVGKGRKNVVLGFHGIDSQDYVFKERKIKATDEINILTDGRFTEKKGLVVLSKAVITLIKDYNFNLKFTIIGLAVGENQIKILNDVKDLFKESGLYDHLFIPGNGSGIQQTEVQKYYYDADIFIYAGVDASGGDADGVPNGLLQAAFSGIPVITTTSGSISDLFNIDNSFIIEQNDSESIVDKFNELMTSKETKKKSERLFTKAEENFGSLKTIKYLEDLLQK